MEQIVFDDETLDSIFWGELMIIQKKNGYRLSIDALLLAYFSSQCMKKSQTKGAKVIELGAGNGIISLILVKKGIINEITSIEIQEILADLALRNVQLNQLDGKIRVIKEDWLNLKELLAGSSFDYLITNPPYRKMGAGRINPLDQKALARHEISGSLEDLLKISAYLLKNTGKMYIIFPAERLIDLFEGMGKNNLEPKRVQFIHSYPQISAKMVLMESVKKSRRGLKVLDPFFVYDSFGNYSKRMRDIYDGKM